MSKRTDQQAYAEISRLTSEAMKLIREAEKIADTHGLEFSFDVAYGMGGTYVPESVFDGPSWREPGWQASSHSC